MRQPDIEIYLKNCPLNSVLDWLHQRFPGSGSTRSAGRQQYTLTIQIDGHPVEVLIVEAVAGKSFTSLWFKSDATPWATDIDCARELHAALGCEVRCNAGGWQDDQDPDLWWYINDKGEGELIWPDA